MLSEKKEVPITDLTREDMTMTLEALGELELSTSQRLTMTSIRTTGGME